MKTLLLVPSSLGSGPAARPTETKVESGTSQSKSGTSVNLGNSGNLGKDEVDGSPDLLLRLSPYIHQSAHVVSSCSQPMQSAHVVSSCIQLM